MDNGIFFKNNSFIVAKYVSIDAIDKTKNKKYSLTTQEHKIFNELLYKIQLASYKDSSISERPRAFFSIDDFKSILKNNLDCRPIEIERTLNVLKTYDIKFIAKKSIVSTSLITSWERDIENFNGYILEVNKKLYEELTGQQEKKTPRTPLNLVNMKNIKGKYTSRVYELIRSWSGTKNVINYKLSEFKELLDIDHMEFYDNYKELKRNVLTPVLKEINSTLNMNVALKEDKVGRRVTGLTFIVEDKEPRRYDFNNTKIDTAEEEKVVDVDYTHADPVKEDILEAVNHNIAKLRKYNIRLSDSTVIKLEDEFGAVEVHNAINILCANSTKTKISAPLKYLKAILANTKNKPIKNNGALTSFHNYEGRYTTEEEMNALERKLLGWDED